MSGDEDHEDDDLEDIAAGEEFLFGFNLDSVQQGVATAADSVASEDDDKSTECIAELLDVGLETVSILKELCQLQLDTTDTVATQNDFIELFEWASKSGAALGGITCQTDSYGGRGIFATRDLGVGEAIAVLPRSLRWGQSFACQELPFLLPSSTPDLTALTILLLHLCRDNHIYAKCLPRRSQFTNAMLMSAEEETAWGQIDANYSDAIRRVRSIGEGCQGYIRHVLLEEGQGTTNDDDPITFGPTLLWAVSMVKSRRHAFGSKRGYWLTPILDLVNHSLTPNAVLVGGDQGQLILQALMPIPEGNEITNDYQVGDDSDAMLLATYGFSLLHQFPTVPTTTS